MPESAACSSLDAAMINGHTVFVVIIILSKKSYIGTYQLIAWYQSVETIIIIAEFYVTVNIFNTVQIAISRICILIFCLTVHLNFHNTIELIIYIVYVSSVAICCACKMSVLRAICVSNERIVSYFYTCNITKVIAVECIYLILLFRISGYVSSADNIIKCTIEIIIACWHKSGNVSNRLTVIPGVVIIAHCHAVCICFSDKQSAIIIQITLCYTTRVSRTAYGIAVIRITCWWNQCLVITNAWNSCSCDISCTVIGELHCDTGIFYSVKQMLVSCHFVSVLVIFIVLAYRCNVIVFVTWCYCWIVGLSCCYQVSVIIIAICLYFFFNKSYIAEKCIICIKTIVKVYCDFIDCLIGSFRHNYAWCVLPFRHYIRIEIYEMVFKNSIRIFNTCAQAEPYRLGIKFMCILQCNGFRICPSG